MRKYIIKALTVCFGLFLTTACLDDDKYALDPEDTGYQNVIEFLDPQVPNSPAGSVYPAWVQAFPIAPEGNFVRTISFSGPNSNDQDIQVTVAVDPIALDQYNKQMNDDLHGATYELLPDDHYDIASLTATIPKGQKTATISVKVFPEVFDLSKKYALPIRITSASTGVLSEHYSVGIMGVVIKNQYDAAYDVEIYAEGWAAFGIQSGGDLLAYPGPIGLVTTGPNTVGLANLYTATNLLPGFDAAGGATQFGAASPEFTFNEEGKMVSVTNAIPDDGRGRQFVMNPDAPEEHNVFNAEDRSITLDFIFKQTGRPDNYQVFKMTFNSER